MIRVKIGQASYAVRGNQYVCSKMLSRLNSVVICHLGKEYKVELIITYYTKNATVKINLANKFVQKTFFPLKKIYHIHKGLSILFSV